MEFMTGAFETLSSFPPANWQRVIPFFSYPEEIRRIIYTTNAIESLNNTLKKTIKNRASFPNDEAAVKLLIFILEKYPEKMDNARQALGQGLKPVRYHLQRQDALIYEESSFTQII